MTELEVRADPANSTIVITAPQFRQFVGVSGPWQADGSFTANGVGTVAGFSNVRVAAQGSLLCTQSLSFEYTVGAGGELPGGQPATYGVSRLRTP